MAAIYQPSTTRLCHCEYGQSATEVAIQYSAKFLIFPQSCKQTALHNVNSGLNILERCGSRLTGKVGCR